MDNQEKTCRWCDDPVMFKKSVCRQHWVEYIEWREERAAIMVFNGGIPEKDAALEAAQQAYGGLDAKYRHR